MLGVFYFSGLWSKKRKQVKQDLIQRFIDLVVIRLSVGNTQALVTILTYQDILYLNYKCNNNK